MRFYCLLYEFVNGAFKIGAAFKLIGEDAERVRDGGVEHDIRAGDGVGRTQHPELKLVAGKGKGRGTVPVGGVLGENGDGIYAEFHERLFGIDVIRVLLECVQNRGKLIAEENGNDSGRRLARAETVVVARRGNAYSHKILIIVNSLYDRRQEQQELHIVMGRSARREKILAGIGSH